jgi:hypothetical protein
MPLICIRACGLLRLVLRRLHQGDHRLFARDYTPTQGGFSLVYLAFDMMTVRSGPHVLRVLC